MKKYSFIAFIVAMFMLSVGCSSDGQTTKADPGGVVFAEYTVPIVYSTIDVPTEAPDILYVGTNLGEIVYSKVNDGFIGISKNHVPLSEFILNRNKLADFAEKPDIVNNIGTNINMKNVRLHSYLTSLPTLLYRRGLYCNYG